jgi:hypothetical protein
LSVFHGDRSQETEMKKLAFGLVSAAMLAMTLPAAAQVGVRVGEDGIGVRVGDRDRAGYRDRDRDHVRYRDRDEGREGRRHRNCDTFWRDHRRVTVCHGD